MYANTIPKPQKTDIFNVVNDWLSVQRVLIFKKFLCFRKLV
jgi:hypothetical protein